MRVTEDLCAIRSQWLNGTHRRSGRNEVGRRSLTRIGSSSVGFQYLVSGPPKSVDGIPGQTNPTVTASVTIPFPVGSPDTKLFLSNVSLCIRERLAAELSSNGHLVTLATLDGGITVVVPSLGT